MDRRCDAEGGFSLSESTLGMSQRSGLGCDKNALGTRERTRKQRNGKNTGLGVKNYRAVPAKGSVDLAGVWQALVEGEGGASYLEGKRGNQHHGRRCTT